MRLKELLTLLFYQSDEDRHMEWEAAQKKKNKHRANKAMKQSFADQIRELAKRLDNEAA